MKKLITTLFVLAAISTAAIAETKLLSVNFAIPFDNINTTTATTVGNSTTTTSSTTNYTSIGFGVTGLSMFSKLVGLYSDVEFGFVQSLKSGNWSSNRSSYYNSQFSMDFLIGPAFRIVETKNIFFSAAPVVHLFMDAYNINNTSYFGGFFGLGADVSFAFFFTKKIGLTAGFDFAYDFLGFGDFGKTTTGNYITTTTTRSNIKCTPKLGLTFRFQ